MDTMKAYLNSVAAQGERHRVFDWDTAARIIRERKPEEASAGLAGDWEYTGGAIYRDGKPVPKGDTYTYLASNWAGPELMLDGELQDCWRYVDECGWDEHTYWPESALAILNEASESESKEP